MPIDELKLDKEFFGFTENTDRSQIITKSLIFLAKRLKICTLAEGVELEEHAKFLQKIGCDQAQGFLYYRPLPISQFETLLHNEYRLIHR